MINREPIGRGLDHLGFIRTKLTDLRGYATLANELIQNADDAQGASSISFDVRQDCLVVDNDGVFSDCGSVKDSICHWLNDPTILHMCDFHRFRTIASGDKRGQEGTSGAFGIGFIAVYQISDHPEVISSKKHWILYDDNQETERILSCLDCEKCKRDSLPNTRFILPWAEDSSSKLRKAFQVEAITLNDKKEILKDLIEYTPSTMLFLRKLSKIEIKENGKLIKTFERLPVDNSIYISDGNIKNDRIWHLIHGDFEKDAAELRLYVFKVKWTKLNIF
jgi:hypothetical protein